MHLNQELVKDGEYFVCKTLIAQWVFKCHISLLHCFVWYGIENWSPQTPLGSVLLQYWVFTCNLHQLQITIRSAQEYCAGNWIPKMNVASIVSFLDNECERNHEGSSKICTSSYPNDQTIIGTTKSPKHSVRSTTADGRGTLTYISISRVNKALWGSSSDGVFVSLPDKMRHCLRQDPPFSWLILGTFATTKTITIMIAWIERE